MATPGAPGFVVVDKCYPSQAVKVGFGSEFAAARGFSQNNGAICFSSQPTSSTNSTIAPGTSAATTSHLRPNATWSDVPAPAKILGLAGTYCLSHMQTTPVCGRSFCLRTLVLLVCHQIRLCDCALHYRTCCLCTKNSYVSLLCRGYTFYCSVSPYSSHFANIAC